AGSAAPGPAPGRRGRLPRAARELLAVPVQVQGGRCGHAVVQGGEPIARGGLARHAVVLRGGAPVLRRRGHAVVLRGGVRVLLRVAHHSDSLCVFGTSRKGPARKLPRGLPGGPFGARTVTRRAPAGPSAPRRDGST